jgi:hypothetical protein
LIVLQKRFASLEPILFHWLRLTIYLRLSLIIDTNCYHMLVCREDLKTGPASN